MMSRTRMRGRRMGRTTDRRVRWGLVSLVIVAVAGCSGDSGGSDASPAEDRGSSAIEGATSTPAPDAHTVEELLALGRPVVLTHSGGEDAHPTATPFAYSESVADGVDVLDFDVRLTADGVLVAHHDEDVDRTTNGAGKVPGMTYDEMHELDAAYWFTEQCAACEDRPDEEYIYRGIRTGEVEPPDGYHASDFAPTAFEEIISAYPDHLLNIEVKGSYPGDVPAAQELARILTETDRLDQAVVTAFDDELAEAFHEAAPTVAITPGLDAMTRYVLGGEALPDDRRIVQIPPEYEGIELLSADFVARAHGDGLVLWIWPNDRAWENREGYDRLLDLGVDGLNAADPAVAVEAVRARQGRGRQAPAAGTRMTRDGAP